VQLPPNRISPASGVARPAKHDKTGTLYWYADPYVCGCMYAGDEAARQRYREIRQSEQTPEQMKAERVLNTEAWDQVGEAPEINMFNPAFSP